MRFLPLYSSSHGNAYIVEEGEIRLLIECGVSFKKLQAAAGFTLSRLAGCLVSHEHKDHAECWEQMARSGIPLYATEGTARALAEESRTYAGTGPFNVLDGETKAGIYRYDLRRVGCFDLRPFRTYHDAAEPVGFFLRSRRSGEALVFATDTVSLPYRWDPPPDIVAVECNYSPELLAQAERIPENVKRRIQHTHMSDERLVRFLRGLDRRRLREVYLLHLSDGSGNEAVFRREAAMICGVGVSVTVCPSGPEAQRRAIRRQGGRDIPGIRKGG